MRVSDAGTFVRALAHATLTLGHADGAEVVGSPELNAHSLRGHAHHVSAQPAGPQSLLQRQESALDIRTAVKG
jgi:hypothetical protein